PSHLRNHSPDEGGNTEWGLRRYITGEAGYNYFDSMTRFYLDMAYGPLATLPGSLYIDRVTYENVVADANIEDVYGMTGYYDPSGTKTYVSWQRRNNYDATSHEVRYAWSDIHVSGWNAATPAPDGTVA